MLSGVGRARHLLCLLLFMPLSSNRLQKPALGLAPGTEPTMPPVGWIVQKAFCGQNSQVAKESNSCRAAAQSNHALQRLAFRLGVARNLCLAAAPLRRCPAAVA